LKARLLRIDGHAIRKKACVGECLRDDAALTTKIFSLPKFATRSPQPAVRARVHDSLSSCAHAARIVREFEKALQRSRFLRS
jgi:hypothetical protein